MALRTAVILIFTIGLLAASGCRTTVRKLKIPLVAGAAPAAHADTRVSIEDLRPVMERRPHRGKEIMSCEHWFGDDSFIPSRVAYLKTRVIDRTRDDMQIHIRLERFDIVEYCEMVRGGDATGASQVSSGRVGFTPAAVNGDTVILRLAGDVNGVRFDQTSSFDYGLMYHFPNAPSSSPAYRAQLRGRIDLLIDDIVNKIWDAELVRKGLARQ